MTKTEIKLLQISVILQRIHVEFIVFMRLALCMSDDNMPDHYLCLGHQFDGSDKVSRKVYAVSFVRKASARLFKLPCTRNLYDRPFLSNGHSFYACITSDECHVSIQLYRTSRPARSATKAAKYKMKNSCRQCIERMIIWKKHSVSIPRNACVACKT